jgi:hypothetical protein
MKEKEGRKRDRAFEPSNSIYSYEHIRAKRCLLKLKLLKFQPGSGLPLPSIR